MFTVPAVTRRVDVAGIVLGAMRLSVPAETVVLPEYVLLPASCQTPAPVLVTAVVLAPPAASLIEPLMVFRAVEVPVMVNVLVPLVAELTMVPAKLAAKLEPVLSNVPPLGPMVYPRSVVPVAVEPIQLSVPPSMT